MYRGVVIVGGRDDCEATMIGVDEMVIEGGDCVNSEGDPVSCIDGKGDSSADNE